jgi:hypothetical protein
MKGRNLLAVGTMLVGIIAGGLLAVKLLGERESQTIFGRAQGTNVPKDHKDWEPREPLGLTHLQTGTAREEASPETKRIDPTGNPTDLPLVSGKVTSQDGEGIEGVFIQLFEGDSQAQRWTAKGLNATTDAAGRYKIFGITRTPYLAIEARHAFYARINLVPCMKGVEDLNIILASLCSVRGVILAGDGIDHRSLSVALEPEGGLRPACTGKVAPNGAFVVRGIHEGRWRFRLLSTIGEEMSVLPGIVLKQEVDVDPLDLGIIDVTRQTKQVALSVRDRNGMPVGNIRIGKANRADKKRMKSPSGEYALLLADTPNEIVVSSEGFLPNIIVAGPGSIAIVLEPAAKMAIAVLGAGELLDSGVQLSLVLRGFEHGGASVGAPCDAFGIARITVEQWAEYSISVRAYRGGKTVLLSTIPRAMRISDLINGEESRVMLAEGELERGMEVLN